MARDYFSEMYIAGVLADAGWNIYFPRRDQGFDFVITKHVGDRVLLRPVQVKGKYPELNKRDWPTYGYIGELTALHPDMLLALPFFPTDTASVAPTWVAYMPRTRIRTQKGRGWRCQPAKFIGGGAVPRKEYLRYFGRDGIAFMERDIWA